MTDMEGSDTYRTIREHSEGIFRDRGSKFLAFAYPVYTTDEIKEIIADLRKKYHDARHHCYAYRLGAARDVFRINDDGEPPGSAGNPIMGQIRSKDLSNILIVVVRYFGGTLLGVSGLINAYRCAAANALANAVIVTDTEKDLVEIVFPYSAMNEIMRMIRDEGMRIMQQEYGDSCRIRASIRKNLTDQILERHTQTKEIVVRRL